MYIEEGNGICHFGDCLTQCSSNSDCMANMTCLDRSAHTENVYAPHDLHLRQQSKKEKGVCDVSCAKCRQTEQCIEGTNNATCEITI